MVEVQHFLVGSSILIARFAGHSNLRAAFFFLGCHEDKEGEMHFMINGADMPGAVHNVPVPDAGRYTSENMFQ